VFYRNALHAVYSGIDKYFTPFFEEGKTYFTNPVFSPELDVHLNMGIKIVPQLVSNNGNFLIRFAQHVLKMGYEEINLNMGCPFPMLVKRKKGGGILSEPEMVAKMLLAFYKENLPVRLSVKMRIGNQTLENGLQLIKILEQFPLEEVIIHPRLVVQKYNGVPDWEAFALMTEQTKLPIVANGDLLNHEDVKNISEQFPFIKAAMIGRGILVNPSLLLDDRQSREADLLKHKQLHRIYFNLVQKHTLDWNQAFNYFVNFWYYPLNTTVEGKRHYRKLRKNNTLQSYLIWLKVTWNHLY